MILQIPVSRIRVIKPRIGGGFGGKQEMVIEDICAALALASRRPVKLEYTRHEEFFMARTRHPQILRLKMGVKKDGTMVAHHMKVLAATGAYGSHATTVQGNTGSKVLPLYRAPHLKFDCDIVYVNAPQAGAFRGYGCPQGFFAQESLVDEIAHELGMDPIAFRLKNAIRQGDVDLLSAELGEGKKGLPRNIRSCGLPECLAQGAAAIGWKEKRNAPRGTGRLRRGVGVACSMQGSGIAGVDFAGAFFKMNEDGSFNLQVGATDLGTGSDTVLAQIAAETLGVSLGKIIIYSSDTDFTPFDASTTSSRTTFHMGNALKTASEDVKAQFIDLAAAVFECGPEEIEAKDGRMGPIDRPKEAMTYVVVMRHQFAAGACLIGRGFYYPPSSRGKPFHGSPSLFWMYGAHSAEVEVDPETGRVEVTRLSAAIDVGRAINPTNCLQQIEGGIVHGVGTTLLEEMVIDAQGHLLNPNLHDYKMPTAMDAPELLPSLVEAHHNEGPYGAKGMGEIVTNAAMAAIGNAVEDAVGVRLTELPLTAEKVYAAIKERGPRSKPPPG
jgi:CO/xanthine dehydrogenase Mo-binding subunit